MPSPSQITQAAEILAAGGLVAFPTETVYGLGADAENPSAVAAIYAAKGRPANHPVIVHLSPEADLSYWVKEIPEEAKKLIAAFWPGPLTLILKRADHIPDAVSGGQDSIGVRCPSHPVAQALLRAFKNGQGGIAAPSANKFGRVSPTTAQHVRDEFATELQTGGLVKAVLEGEQSEVGIESTILDLTRLGTHGPVLLRPGHICIDQLAAVLGAMPVSPDVASDVSTPRASGTLEAHYAPHTPVVIVTSEQLISTLQQLHNVNKKVALLHYSTQNQGNLCTELSAEINLPNHPAKYAHELYASLRQLDAASADVIVVQALPDTTEWHGVRDRLRRAAHDSLGVLANLLAKQS
ncbi:L-threonylcarbamoyladenylate synthase [Solimicrobium silvestre]|uniref:Threonylcarbamoyl-AMP synthase n=1 Tax=Solimicrobium silvestre TaxID=2099400 RepID=A0A2S9GXF9_9BURK|nr:L-threonylcarbamoyladenylate synthase [Solimicrobium silvestre]PRC92407.1 tRNA threonylcarbamoyl adenosine modification protein [Solimicrobium silvestre]